MTDDAQATLRPTATTDAPDTVRKFLFALAEQDFDTFESLAAPDLVWQNVGLPSIRGRSRIMKMLRRGEGKFGFLVKFHRIAASDERLREERTGTDGRLREERTGAGATVLTERTDALVFGKLRLQFWVCGTFELNDAGQVTLWRDYFDYADFLIKAPLRALAGLVVPSLRPTF
ncbi:MULTISPECIES: limonene-1,2-epoxide hydrolase family protein [Mycolicibacterium]|jgi:limonene-1,2-epoxide hydrolase|uniref:limonene-1,2-epoxide hydrolase family protein n=1 Tax=Mycolicibacterium TaxID=1866885 RepID=UPI0005606597|nr:MULTISPECIES: limonene-1,2-epoxide hydrolase family protein [Mycolicibacterium]QZY48446.1 nuclear transport factor 2 family protein [Mycolicibacterium austroafricanum]UJL26967.1 nuclear transport factor 2 family protein [Mycolicibacterium vanbaalenii]WND59087.1 limonene-1,2-epoxide hydrolase family protein [Mycolicibacterium vanbaalenii]